MPICTINSENGLIDDNALIREVIQDARNVVHCVSFRIWCVEHKTEHTMSHNLIIIKRIRT